MNMKMENMTFFMGGNDGVAGETAKAAVPPEGTSKAPFITTDVPSSVDTPLNKANEKGDEASAVASLQTFGGDMGKDHPPLGEKKSGSKLAVEEVRQKSLPPRRRDAKPPTGSTYFDVEPLKRQIERVNRCVTP